MPEAGGTSLGVATGRIQIDTSGLQAVNSVTAQVGQQAEKNLARIGTGAKKAETGLTGLHNSLKGIGAAFGVQLGLEGVKQFAALAVEIDAVATAYKRQTVAAVSLAGSQGALNDLLEAYDQATGGAIDKATALSDVVRLQAVGFGDSAEELSRFATAARGISVAMGSSQDYVISQLQLAIANQSTMRLDQLGLGVSEVEARIKSLQAADKGLSKEMAYQNAILSIAEEKFGELAKSAVAGATGMEKLAKSWKELKLAVGEESSGAMDVIGISAAMFLDVQTQRLKEWSAELDIYIRLLRSMGIHTGALTTADRQAQPALLPSAANQMATRPVAGPRWGANQEAVTEAIVERSAGMKAIEADAYAERLEANRSFNESMASTERDYGQAISREAEDFARSRQRAEAEFAESIADIHRDAGRRELEQAEELARTVANARSDSAERLGEWAEDHEKRLADVRADSIEKLVELDEQYARSREKALRDHNDKLSDAAGRLDANAVYQEQKRFAQESKDAAEAHGKQKSDLEEALQERIDQENESYAERLDDEAKSLAKSIRQANEAHERQLQDARDADAQRIEDMKADFEQRKAEEDIDRGIRLARMAEDHAARLGEMARQHALDMEQIAADEAEKRAKLQEEFDKEMEELGVISEKRKAANKKIADDAIKEYDRIMRNIELRTLGLKGLSDLPGMGMDTADPYADRAAPAVKTPAYTFPQKSPVGGYTYEPAARVSNLNMAPNAIVINGAVGQSEEKIGDIVVKRLIGLFEEAA